MNLWFRCFGCRLTSPGLRRGESGGSSLGGAAASALRSLCWGDSSGPGRVRRGLSPRGACLPCLQQHRRRSLPCRHLPAPAARSSSPATQLHAGCCHLGASSTNSSGFSSPATDVAWGTVAKPLPGCRAAIRWLISPWGAWVGGGPEAPSQCRPVPTSLSQLLERWRQLSSYSDLHGAP